MSAVSKKVIPCSSARLMNGRLSASFRAPHKVRLRERQRIAELPQHIVERLSALEPFGDVAP
jgi:hypothetical protein